MQVSLVSPHAAPRPDRQSPPSRRRPIARHHAVPAQAGPAEAPPIGTKGEGAGPGPSTDPVIEERWRVPQAEWRREQTRVALRRAQVSRLCMGQMDGVLDTREKEICARFWDNMAARTAR